MPRIDRNGHFIKIFSLNAKGQEQLVAFRRLGDANHEAAPPRGLRFYDAGDEYTYTSRYQLGMEPAKTRVFAERPETLVAAFRDAGIRPPLVLPPAPVGQAIYRLRGQLARIRWQRSPV